MSERLERDIPGARRSTIAGGRPHGEHGIAGAVNKALGGFLARGVISAPQRPAARLTRVNVAVVKGA